MKATLLLKRDHQAVTALFDALERLPERASRARRELFEQIRRDLIVHARVEEELFYPELVQQEEAADLVREARAEHDLMRDLLGDIARTKADDPDQIARLAVLRENVEHHAEQEENDIFPLAKRLISSERLEKLAAQIEERKDQLLRPRKVEPA